MPNYVNLNEVGGLTQSGQGYGGEADTGAAEARTFASRMEASQTGLRGRTGAQFTNVTGTHGGNLALLAQQFAEQAVRAVRGEQTIVAADDEAHGAQQGTAASIEGQTSLISRPINA